MKAFIGGCFNELYYRALSLAISHSSKLEQSRVGPMVNLGQAYFEMDGEDPRLVFLNERKINPIFAIIEAAWVLSGSNLVAPLKLAISDYAKYSDDGVILNGAYGYRIKHHFNVDQLEDAISALIVDQSTRRVVLTLYEPADIAKKSLDIPCNTTVYLKARDGYLDMTVLNRSNDLYLGIPYNVFVFGVLQAYLARRIGLRRGKQIHFTDCLHLYEENFVQAQSIVSSNHVAGIRYVSSQFNWNYVDSILDNINEIALEHFDEIKNEDLKYLLNFFIVEKLGNEKFYLDEIKQNFAILAFIFYQWKVRLAGQNHVYGHLSLLREKLMENDMHK